MPATATWSPTVGSWTRSRQSSRLRRLCGLRSERSWFGPAGTLAVAEHRWPDAARRDRLFEMARASLTDPALDIMFGHPGYMALAAELHARTGEDRWADLWADGADRLFDEWRRDEELGGWFWTQVFGGKDARYVGAAHGLLGNLNVLLRGGELLSAERRAEVEQRAVETLTGLAVVEDGLANWPPGAGDSLVANDRIRVQRCHGAAGVVATLARIAPDDEAWGALLLAGGRLVWESRPDPRRAGPLSRHGRQRLRAARPLAAHRRRAMARARPSLRAPRRAPGRRPRGTPRARASLAPHGDEGVATCLGRLHRGDADSDRRPPDLRV